MKIEQLHSWDVSYKQAREIQETLSAGISLKPVRQDIRIVAGIDCAFSRDKKRIGAVVIVCRLGDFEVVEQSFEVMDVTFPYISGLLSFREAPVCIAAAEKIKTQVDAFLIDGQGIAHPRRLGLASHLGLILGKPSVGCAKSRLIGQYDQPGDKKGSYSFLRDKGEKIGAVLRTRDNIKPMFISPGHLCSIADAIDITLRCTVKYRLPEPTRLAHTAITGLKPQI